MSKAAARIRTAASEAFAAKGYGGASLRDIAASLDLSPGALYPHYKTKESLLFAISLDGHEEALEALRQVDDSAAPAADRLAATVRTYVTWHARHRDRARVIQHELRSLSPEHFRTISALRRSTSHIFHQIIKEGNGSGQFETSDVESAALAVMSLAVDVSRWFPSRTFMDPDTLAERYAEIALKIVGHSSL